MVGITGILSRRDFDSRKDAKISLMLIFDVREIWKEEIDECFLFIIGRF